jgi:DNA-cytosine methyltransferase
MLHISLFSGIGGFDLASEWMGWQNIASCEINPFGRKVLEYYWPNAYHHDDIKTLTYKKLNEELTKKHGAEWRADDIVLTGGFPCQPYSLAGKRLGNEDERHLWPEMLRVIREVSPKWIVGENVFGLVNWSEGLVFNEVQTDLEAIGYEVQSYVLPACGVNAPHKRDRIFIIAYSNKYRYNANGGAIKEENGLSSIGRPTMESGQFNRTSNNRPIAHTNNTGGSSRLGEIQGENGEIPEWYNDAEFSDSSSRTTQNPLLDGRLFGQHGNEIRSEVERCGGVDVLHPDGTSKQREHIGQEGEREFNRPNSGNGINNF